jgi:cytochrome c-type biogenesis protein CcmH
VKLVLLSLLAMTVSGAAKVPQGEMEAVARRLEGKLMAPCCWAQTVSHHYSPIADEMRKGIREKLNSGMSEPQVVEAYIAQYGERILASPPARGFNLLAWVLPGAFALLGAGVLVLALRRFTAAGRGAVAPTGPAPLNVAYAARIDRELRDEE